MTGRATNWAGNIVFGAGTVHRPATVDQLQGIVASHAKVRALGSGHSFNEIADSPGDLVSLAGLPPIVEVDTAAGTARVGGGVRYADVGPRLHESGFALHNLASLPHISIAGSCATATHGSGDGNGNLATAVSAMELVTADGDIATLSRDKDGDVFRGSVVGLGALGIVVSLTLDLVPAFDVRQDVYEGLPFEVLDDHFDDIVSSAYSVSLFTDWRAPRFNHVWFKRRVDESGVPATGATWPPVYDWFAAEPADGPRHPVPGMSPEHCTLQQGVPGPWFERLPHFRPDFTPSSSGAEIQSEYLVPRRHAVEALHALAGMRERIAPVLHISELRTIAADELWLSPAYHQDLVGFHFTWVKDAPRILTVLPAVERALEPFGAVPHWGKLFTVPPETMRYQRLPDFRDLVRGYDPNGKFANDMLRRYVLDPA